MAVVFAGKRLIKVDDVVAYERLVTVRRDEFARKVRIAARAFHTHKHLRPQLRQMIAIDKFKYLSRKLLRWFGAVPLLLAMVFFIAALMSVNPWAGIVAAALTALVTVLTLKVKRGPIGQVGDILLAVVATMVGVCRASLGHTFVTWSPSQSR
jgi:hypothetical protein